jgi:hypothetical protein
MYRLRLLAVLTFVAILGASLARGQDGTEPFNKQGDQKNTQEKAKNSDNQRRHWWSPPHLFHKKHDNAGSSGQTGNSPFSKTAAGANTTAQNQTVKTSDNKVVAAANAPKTSSTSKTVTGARPTATTAARTQTARKGPAGNTQIKKTTGTAGKKPVRHDCTPEQAKKTGCAVDKASSHKGTTNPS